VKSTPSARSTDDPAPTPTPTLILSGPRGSGKSSRLIEAVTDVSTRFPVESLSIRGVVSRGVHDAAGFRTGFDAELFPSRQVVPLARVRHLERARHLTTEEPDAVPPGYTLAVSPDPIPAGIETFPLGPFQFYRSAFTAAEAEILGEGAPGENHPVPGYPPARVVVIDEIGPLELRRYDGFYHVLSRLISTRVALVLTVRPDLLETLEELCRTGSHRRVQSIMIGSDGNGIATRTKIVTFIGKEII